MTAALVLNGLIGDRGLTALLKARRDSVALRRSLEQLQEENAALRDEIERLTWDPGTIEAAARRDLGLARPDELVFIVKDVERPR